MVSLCYMYDLARVILQLANFFPLKVKKNPFPLGILLFPPPYRKMLVTLVPMSTFYLFLGLDPLIDDDAPFPPLIIRFFSFFPNVEVFKQSDQVHQVAEMSCPAPLPDFFFSFCKEAGRFTTNKFSGQSVCDVIFPPFLRTCAIRQRCPRPE